VAGVAACVQRLLETPAQAAQGIPPTPSRRRRRHRLIFVNPHTGQFGPHRDGFQSFLASISPGNPEAIHLRLSGPIPEKILLKVRDGVVADGVPRPKISVVSTGTPAHSKARADVAVQVDAVVDRDHPA
jgi:hypothetical protein